MQILFVLEGAVGEVESSPFAYHSFLTEVEIGLPVLFNSCQVTHIF